MIERMTLEVGQIVYTMYDSGSGSKAEVVAIPEAMRKSAFNHRKGWYFRLRPLENFSLLDGWGPYQNRTDGKLRPEIVTVNQKNIYTCLRDAMPLVEKAKSIYIDGNRSDICRVKQQKARLEEALVEYEHRHAQLEKINVPALLGLDTYVSIFTGKVT